MSEVLDSKEELKERRGRMLQVLCILSWIYVGIVFVFNLLAFTNGQASPEEMENRQISLIDFYDGMGIDKETIKELMVIDERTNDNFYLNYSSKLVFCLIGFFAVLQMWKLQKTGFWVYIAYSIIPIGIMYYIMGDLPSTMQSVVWELVWAALFIGLYASQVKRME